MNRKFVVLAGLLFFISCSEPTPPYLIPDGYEFRIDSVSIFHASGDAAIFAEQNFSKQSYLLREYQYVSDTTNGHTSVYHPSLGDWRNSPNEFRLAFLHTVDSSRQFWDVNGIQYNAGEYYYHLANSFDQFGYGWKDTYDTLTADLNNGEQTNYVWNVADSSFFFVGPSDYFLHYLSLCSIDSIVE